MNTSLNTVLDTMLSASGLSEDFKQGIKVTKALSEAIPAQPKVSNRILVLGLCPSLRDGTYDKIDMIKCIRENVDIGLAEAKYLVESMAGVVWRNGDFSKPFTMPCTHYSFLTKDATVAVVNRIRRAGFLCEVL